MTLNGYFPLHSVFAPVWLAMQQLSAKVFKLSFEYFHIYGSRSGDFCRKKCKIASLTSCHRSDLRKTLKYSQSRDLEGIQWILWTRVGSRDMCTCCGRMLKFIRSARNKFAGRRFRSDKRKSRSLRRWKVT